MAQVARLKLAGMDARHRALTPPIAGGYEEAASVCLQRHHESPIGLDLEDNGTLTPAEIEWTDPSQRQHDAWANVTDATRDGAYGCVIAGVEHLRGLVAVRRADVGSGADYFVGPPGSGVDDLEDCIRLEVSGVDVGPKREIERRLRRKIAQVLAGKGDLPALAGVMGFAACTLMIADVEEER